MTIEAPELRWPSTSAPEREMLEGYLDAYRVVLLRKAAGLSQEQLAVTLPPSPMTLGGLLKHMAIVEEGWFTQCLSGDDLPEPWASVDWDADRDWEWHSAADDTPEELGAVFDAACARSRSAAAGFDSLDALAARPGETGEPFSLRWIYVHMIEEYARHVGHADLIRESIDGQVGDGG
jgi:uncharacterized damage-inducible protein DinB